jgi:uncharacterized protein YndB with AHSA1/START domain
MPIPNTITRTLELPHPQEKVWSALTTNDGLASWFGNAVTGDVTPGSDVVMTWDEGHVANLGIKVVDPMSVFAYCWSVYGAPDDDPRRTYVEFRLVPTSEGVTLTVTRAASPRCLTSG